MSDALARTSSIFSSMDCAIKSNAEIVSKSDALKEKKMEFDHSLLAKKQATWRLSELGARYDALKERIMMLTKELEMKKAKLTSLVEQVEAIKA